MNVVNHLTSQGCDAVPPRQRSDYGRPRALFAEDRLRCPARAGERKQREAHKRLRPTASTDRVPGSGVPAVLGGWPLARSCWSASSRSSAGGATSFHTSSTASTGSDRPSSPGCPGRCGSSPRSSPTPRSSGPRCRSSCVCSPSQSCWPDPAAFAPRCCQDRIHPTYHLSNRKGTVMSSPAHSDKASAARPSAREITSEATR